MAKQYKTNREKILLYFQERIIPNLAPYAELDYKKTIGMVAIEVGVTEQSVEEVLIALINGEKLQDRRFLSLSEKEIEVRKRLKDEQFNRDMKEAGVEEKK